MQILLLDLAQRTFSEVFLRRQLGRLVHSYHLHPKSYRLCPDTTVTIPGDSVDARLAVISDRRYESVDHVLHSRNEG
ncbi:hypothetical protein ABKN59_000918 [Abortiporus biennis]